jgi:RNA polymerase sigma-70 factor, ECF subfamily
MLVTDATSQDEPGALVAQLFEEHYRRVFAYLARMVCDAALAEDLTQQAFLQVYLARSRLPGIENRRAWVYRVATNLALTALRRRGRFAWLPWRVVDVHVPDSAGDIHEWDAVERALAAVPADFRAPLLLYSHYGLHVIEIAEALNIPAGTVKSRLHRARAMFLAEYHRQG